MADWSWLANTAPDSPESYQGMQLRQRIALQLMSKDRKGYPKTLGEGLTSIGDAIGDIGSMRAALALQSKIDAKKEADAPPTARQQTSDAGDTSTEVPVRVASADPADTVQPDEPLVAQTRSIAPVIPADAGATVVPVAMPRRAAEAGPATPIFPQSQGFPASTRPRLDPTVQIASDPNFTPAPMTGPTTQGEAAPWLHNASAAQAFPRPSQGLPLPVSTATGDPTDAARSSGYDLLRAGRRSDVAGDEYAYPQTASLQTGDTMSDAPPLGINPRLRAAIALTEQQQTAPEVPQLNPMQTGPTAPTTLGAMTATSPAEASGNRQLQSDISPMPQPQAGARLAENVAPLAPRRPTDQPVVTPPPTTASPLPEQKPGEFDPSPPPPKPAPEPRSKEQFDAEQRAIYLESRGAPAETVKSWRDQAAILEAERARKEAYTTKQYESDLAQYNARETAKATARQKIPETQETLKQQRLATQQAQQKQDLEAQFGNLPQHVHEYLAKGKENTMLAVNSLEGLKNARMAMDAGTLFGIDAPIKLLYYQARAAAGDADASRIVAATQNYKTSLGPLAAQAIRAYGGTQISNQDRIMGMQMSGADVSLDEKSARRLLDIAERSAVAKINEHRGDLDNMLQKQPPMLRRMYDVPDPLAPVPADKGAGAPKEFASEADAAAARLPRGTKVRINGRMGTVQ